MAKAISCHTSGNTVYIRDEKGTLIDQMTFPQPPMAQSFGNGVTITCGTMCYTYMLDNNQLKQTGMNVAIP